MNRDYYAVIMAGGIGTRFWPVSTQQFPKQFHDMLGTGQSLLQKTFSRLHKIIPSENIYILTNELYLDLTLEQLPEIGKEQVVLEPAMRNTAPCILLSALKIRKQNPNALMLVAPSDHWIEDEKAFEKDVKLCFDTCGKKDQLLTLGIQPTFPNTGYGYIEFDINDAENIKKVVQFREKPDYQTASKFVKEGNYLWNAGIFLWSVKSIISSFLKNMPEMYELFSKGIPVYNTLEERNFISTHYKMAENISIDYGIMEKADNVLVKKATFDWNDLGTWGALHDKMTTLPTENAVIRALTDLNNSHGNIIYTSKEKLVVIEDLDNFIIVDNEKVLLIYPKSKEQNIKGLVNEIKIKFGPKYN